MRRNDLSFTQRLASIMAVTAIMAACVEPSSPPTRIIEPGDPSLAITSIRTDIGNFPAGLGEGEHRICKAANTGAPAQSFSFSIVVDGGTPTVVNLAPGECYEFSSTLSGSRFSVVTVTEAAPPANWALGDIDITRYIPTFFPNYNPPAGAVNSYDLPTRTATLGVNADFSTVVTFNNVFTPPPPPPPPAGCTYTQGYWKTHSLAGPAPYDAGWKKVGPLEQDTPFFSSGKTWLEMFRTPVRGSAYVALAHQYMAAKLNVLNGAAAPASVTSALAQAESYFGGASVSISGLAGRLDDYNNGLLGTPHCGDTTLD